MYWAILKKAGFDADEERLVKKGLTSHHAKHFDPHFNKNLRSAAYQAVRGSQPPGEPKDLEELVSELEVIAQFNRDDPNNAALMSGNKPMLDADDKALLNFLHPAPGSSGPLILRGYKTFHSAKAGDFVSEILKLIDQGKTVILDLGNATDRIRQYFSDLLSTAVFGHQERKFVANALGEHFVQLYFEEAHNLFPRDDKDLRGVYARFAKEGAKFHIGMVYSTQSPSTVNRDLLAQTENFFIAHLSSRDEVGSLSRLNVAYETMQDDILSAKTPGYIRMLTRSHRFVVSVQAKKFSAKKASEAASTVGSK